MAVPSSPACMDKAQPESSKHSLPAQQEPPRVQEEKPKVSKASARVEEGGLDSGAPSTGSEHVAITKAEPTFTMVGSLRRASVQACTHRVTWQEFASAGVSTSVKGSPVRTWTRSMDGQCHILITKKNHVISSNQSVF